MIVVAELDLGDADGVVFIDDGQTIPLEKRQYSIAGVEVAGAVVEVAGGEEDLGGVRAVLAEAFLVGPHEKALADGGASLQVPQVGRPAAEVQVANARPNGPGADQRNLSPTLADTLHLIGQ